MVGPKHKEAFLRCCHVARRERARCARCVRRRRRRHVGRAVSGVRPTVAAVSIDPGWPVAVALVVLLAIALAAHRVNGYGLERPALVAALRAIAQLGVAALLIAAVVDHLLLSIALVCVMFAMGVLTTTRRVDAPNAWRPAAVAMAAGVIPSSRSSSRPARSRRRASR